MGFEELEGPWQRDVNWTIRTPRIELGRGHQYGKEICTINNGLSKEQQEYVEKMITAAPEMRWAILKILKSEMDLPKGLKKELKNSLPDIDE